MAVGVPLSSVIAIASVPATVGVYVSVYVPLELSLTVTVLPAFAPLTVAATVPLVPVRLLPWASFAWTVIVVTLPAVPAGTDAVVCAALAAPATTVIAADVP